MLRLVYKECIGLKIIKLSVCLVLTLSLCGCWSSKELDELAIVMGIGVENKEEEIECTTQVIVPQNVGTGKEGGPPSGEPYVNFVTREKHLSTCISNVSSLTGKSMYMSHDLVIILGRNAAHEGIYSHLDYFMRDTQLRFNVSLLVADGDVNEILDTKAELAEVPAINIATISTALKETSTGREVTVLNFIENMMSKQKGTLVPIVSIDRDNGNPQIIVKGAAVFSDDKMVGEIDDKQTHGVLWLSGDMGSGDIILDTGDASISLKLNRSMAKTEVKFGENGEIWFDALVKADMYMERDDANIIEILGMDAVKEKLDEAVKAEIEDSLSLMKEIGVDVYGFGDMIYRKKPAAWRAIEDRWNEIFKSVHVNVKVDCGIRESGSIIGSVRNSEANEY